VVVCQVLGGLSVDGMSLTSTRQRRLLVALVIAHGDVVSTDRLADLMWDGKPPPGHNALQTYVSRLRTRLGALAVVHRPPGYALVLRADQVDAWRFESLVDGARQQPPASALQTLDDALCLWRGAAYAEFRDTDFARGDAVRLEELRAAAEVARLDLLLNLGRADDASAEAARLIEMDPYRESLWERRMRALHATGRTVDAVRAFHDYRARLADETGLEPSAELAALERVLVADPGGSAVPADVALRSGTLEEVAKPIPPSGTVTFLFTDIEDSTQLWDKHPKAMSQALIRHDQIVGETITAHRGHVFSTGGDGVGAAFFRSVDAVEAAVDLQRRIRGEAWPADAVLRVRMGIHTGEAEEREGNYFGPPLNQAARITNAARGGQIVLSNATANLVDSRAAGIEVFGLGTFRLKGITEAVSLFGVVTDELRWTGQSLATADRPHGNLLRPITEFVGRSAELQQKASELPKHRLMTLTGTGGVGKTRLATELGWLTVDEFVDGIWLVELAPVADPNSVVTAVATILSIPVQPGMTLLASVVDWLRGRRALLIMDNCEHVIGAAVELIGAVLTGCPTVTVLATSREPLGISGERAHRVPALDPASEAVELFCARATAADDSFNPDDRDRATISAICRRLDGLPLAIELAAARTTSLSPRDLLNRLADRLRLVDASRRHPDRHQTLQATVDWSYQLLTDSERSMFDRLSVFAGGFDLRAARAVCTDATLADADVDDLVGSLVDKSIVIAERDASGVRYRLLETLRQYAQERLVEIRESHHVYDRHLAHFAQVAGQTRQRWASPQQPDADAWFEREWDNLRAAHSWAVTEAHLDAADAIIAATGPYAHCHLIHEHGTWATRTLGADTSEHQSNPITYGWAAYWTYAGGDTEYAIELAHRGIDIAPEPEHPDTAVCWSSLVTANLAAGNHIEAQNAASRASQAADASRDRFASVWAQSHVVMAAFDADVAAVGGHVARLALLAEATGAPSLLARLAYFQGRVKLWLQQPTDPEGALATYRRGVEWARMAGDIAHENWNLLGIVFAEAVIQGPNLRDVFRDAISHLYDTRDWVGIWLAMIPVSSWLESTGNTEAATILFGYLEAHRTPWRGLDGRLQSLRGPHEHSQANQLIAQGAVMDRDQVAAFAVEQLARPAAP
jgi:predicted ATPase/class 3 adenylate cyclase